MYSMLMPVSCVECGRRHLWLVRPCMSTDPHGLTPAAPAESVISNWPQICLKIISATFFSYFNKESEGKQQKIRQLWPHEAYSQCWGGCAVLFVIFSNSLRTASLAEAWLV